MSLRETLFIFKILGLLCLLMSEASRERLAIAAEIPPATHDLEEATFAGGCFWCVEADFDKLKGVLETISGYTGGHTPHPTYESVGTHQTGHVEAVRVRFDPKVVSYEKLLDYYVHHIDYLDGDGQFCDRGNTYRPVIFTHTPEQDTIAHKTLTELERSRADGAKVGVTIQPVAPFTAAEDYHQEYYKKNPIRYAYYRKSCGRDARVQKLWGSQPTKDPLGRCPTFAPDLFVSLFYCYIRLLISALPVLFWRSQAGASVRSSSLNFRCSFSKDF